MLNPVRFWNKLYAFISIKHPFGAEICVAEIRKASKNVQNILKWQKGFEY